MHTTKFEWIYDEDGFLIGFKEVTLMTHAEIVRRYGKMPSLINTKQNRPRAKLG